jgi:hypothetical protein
MSFIKDSIAGVHSRPVFQDKEAAHCIFDQAKNDDSKVIVMAGDNASGKSLVCRYIRQRAQEAGLLSIEISMADRNKKGYMEMARSLGRYGDEDAESTGHLTFYRLVKDIERLQEKKEPWLLVLDEPELGMGEDYFDALGKYIGSLVNDFEANKYCQGVVIVSHAKVLLKSLFKSLEQDTQTVYVGDVTLSLMDWLNGTQMKSVEELMRLTAKAKARRKVIHTYLK